MLSLTAPDRPKVCLRAQAAARGQQRARLAASAGRSCFGRRRSAWANGAAGGLGGAYLGSRAATILESDIAARGGGAPERRYGTV